MNVGVGEDFGAFGAFDAFGSFGFDLAGHPALEAGGTGLRSVVAGGCRCFCWEVEDGLAVAADNAVVTDR